MPFEITEIKLIRKKLGITQADLSKQAGVSQSLIAKIESERIIKNKEQNEKLESMDEFPEDIKKGIIDLNLKGITAQEKRLSILKTKL